MNKDLQELIDSLVEGCVNQVQYVFEQNAASSRKDIAIEAIKDSLERLEDERI